MNYGDAETARVVSEAALLNIKSEKFPLICDSVLFRHSNEATELLSGHGWKNHLKDKFCF